jgi:hypothetical protein
MNRTPRQSVGYRLNSPPPAVRARLVLPRMSTSPRDPRAKSALGFFRQPPTLIKSVHTALAVCGT